MKKWLVLFTAILTVQMSAAVRHSPEQHQIYKEINVTPGMVEEALKTARMQNKFLMVQFGANWCPDCVALAHSLEQSQTRDYLDKHFVVLKVNVGQFNRNLGVAQALGVDLNKGIPTAIFFAPDGNKVGATNKGELEPAQKYGVKEIYDFLMEIAEKRIISAPRVIPQ